MIPIAENAIRQQLAVRRRRLEAALATAAATAQLEDLLRQVDGALERIEAGTWGLCDLCHEPVEGDRLLADPLVRLCLDHLDGDQRRALEHDLATAARIQAALLPPRDLAAAGWEFHYRYEPAGPVSGDYCDLVPNGDGLYFFFGDVSGKGVSASILNSHLQAIVRGLIAAGTPLAELVASANRLFCESTLPSHFATVVAGRVGSDGELELLNAGHPPPLLLAGGEVRELAADGLPLGMFRDARYAGRRARLAPGDALLLYTDGVSEGSNAAGEEYGSERLGALLRRHPGATAAALARAAVDDVETFRAGAPRSDDLTVMAVRRTA